jgi:hypothetical protein
MAAFSLADLPALPADQRFSVWQRLQHDPQARKVRAYWETKWATFCEPAASGGPPARADLLPYWEPDTALDSEARERWQDRAYRLALGIEVVAHLEPIVDEERLCAGFCVRSAALAEAMRDAILGENMGAIVARAHPGEHGEQTAACDVLLACHPDASDEDVKHGVVAATKTAHALLCALPGR